MGGLTRGPCTSWNSQPDHRCRRPSVGNAEDPRLLSGVTVVLPASPPRPWSSSAAARRARGGDRRARSDRSRRPGPAVVLSGGSVFGLDAASGVTMRGGPRHWLSLSCPAARLPGGARRDPVRPAENAATRISRPLALCPARPERSTTPPHLRLGMAGAGYGAFAAASRAVSAAHRWFSRASPPGRWWRSTASARPSIPQPAHYGRSLRRSKANSPREPPAGRRTSPGNAVFAGQQGGARSALAGAEHPRSRWSRPMPAVENRAVRFAIMAAMGFPPAAHSPSPHANSTF